jgi:RNA polymerase sigma-70 factor (ECF subfamily)
MSESTVMARGSGEVSSWDLVTAAQEGDRDAFGELYRRYRGPVFDFVASCVGAGLAEDITSEVFCRALQAISSVTYQGRDIGAWLRTIARNLVRDHLKSACHRRVVVSTSENEWLTDSWVSPGVEEDVVRRETVEEVRARIARLPRPYQKYITLRYLGGFSVRETARVLGHREGTVKSGTSRAIRDLRALVAGEGVA